VHEAGHLVFGLATGWSFISFRIGPVMLEKRRGRMRLYRYSVPGTLGQCLLRPPAYADGAMPYKLYNMGGCIAGAAVAVIALVLAFFLPKNDFLVMGFVLFGVAGLVTAIVNGIPMSDKLSNDGANTRDCGKNPLALYALWLQLEVHYQQVEGSRIEDLPDEWFVMPEGADLENPMTAVLAVIYENRLMAAGDYEAAAALVDGVRAEPNGIFGIYWAYLNCDRMTVALMAGDSGVVDALWTREQIRMMRALRSQPGTVRTEYALALLADKNMEAARRYADRFRKMARTYPVPGECASEATIMADVRDAASVDEIVDVEVQGA
jgi:hypothetical protein